ncbi:MAG: hypothetical protein ABWK05_05945 [Pyrobaculum sp.]
MEGRGYERRDVTCGSETTTKKEAIWQAVRTLGVDGLKKVRGLLANLKLWVEAAGTNVLEKVLGEKIELRDLAEILSHS